MLRQARLLVRVSGQACRLADCAAAVILAGLCLVCRRRVIARLWFEQWPGVDERGWLGSNVSKGVCKIEIKGRLKSPIRGALSGQSGRFRAPSLSYNSLPAVKHGIYVL